MKDETRNEIGRILAQYEQEEAASQRRQEKRETDLATFPDRFNSIGRDVIKPALEEFRREIIAKGHDADVELTEHAADPSRQTRNGIDRDEALLDGVAHRLVQQAHEAVDRICEPISLCRSEA